MAEEEVIELYVGESIPLDTKVVSGEVIKDESGIVWTYSKDGICSISSNDTIAGKKAGKVTVTGNLNKGGSILEVQFDVLVKNTVKAVEVTTPDQDLRVGETFIVTYNVVPVDLLPVPMSKGVKFKSMDVNVATVNSSGTVTIVGIGDTYIQVESTEAGKKDYVQVNVEATVDKISINEKMEEIYVGETKLMTVKFTPISGKEIFSKECEWISFDTSILTVKEGVIEGKKEGETSLRAISDDNGKMSTVGVDVISGVKDVEISENKVELSHSYASHELSATVIPVDELDEPFEDGVTWKSSNTSVCSVSSSGKLTGKKTGTSTITVETKDGGHKAYASVKVSMPSTTTEDSTVKVKNITFNMSNTRINVGEKILLDFTVEPENANRDSIKISVRSSGVGKIEKESGLFYYTALKDGVTYLDASADGNKYDSTTIFSDTMLEGFDISNDTFVRDTGWNLIYIGQKLEIIPDFDMVTGDYPLLDDVKYTSSDTKTAKIVDGNYVEAIKVGEFSIKGVTADNGYEDSIVVKVISNIEELQTEKSARIGIDMAYEPTVYFIAKEDPYYGLEKVLSEEFTLELDKVKVSAEFIKNEIDYTENRKAELEALVDKRSGDLEEHLNELQECYHRLFVYERVYKEKSGDFCDLTEANVELTDRSYKNLDVAYIKSNKLYANIVSEIDLLVQSQDPEKSTIVTVSVEDNVSSIVIFDEDGEIITASVENVLNHYTDEILFQNNPSSWAVDHIKLANSKGLLVDEVVDNYQANITREEFMELVMNFYDVVLDFPEVSVTGDVFTDTNNPTVLKAYELGIISGRGPGIFAPNDNVTREEMCVILDKTLKVMNKSLEVKKTYRDFEDASQVSSWAKTAVDKMANEHDIIAGVGGNMFLPKGNATKEHAIIVIYKVFDRLK